MSRLGADDAYIDFSPDERLAWIYFLKAYKVVVEAVDKELRDNSVLTLAEFELLVYINQAGGRLRFIDLAKLSLLSQSRISRQIDALQNKGFLCREITDSDRRATFAVMTPAGQRALDGAEASFREAFNVNFLDIISRPQLGGFADILKRLLRNPGYPTETRAIIEQARTANAERP